MDTVYILYIIVGFLFLPVFIWGIWASIKVNNTFSRFANFKSERNANDVAKMMLQNHGISDVKIIKIEGNLTDNYNPNKKTLSLSESVYGSNSVSAIGVAAHECGHAIQHKEHYMPLIIRRTLVPVVNLFSKMFLPLLIIGVLLNFFSYFFYAEIFVYVALGFYGSSLLFSLVTLPVEFNASNRAIKELEAAAILPGPDVGKVREVLNAAAMTYVVSFFTSLIYFLHFLLRLFLIFGRRK